MDRRMDEPTGRRTEKKKDRWTDRETYKLTVCLNNRQTSEHLDRHTDGYFYIDRKVDIQTDRKVLDR